MNQFLYIKVDLLNGTMVDSTLVPGAGRLPVYSLNPNTYLDLAVDELGLWVIHADPEYEGNLVITKLDKGRHYPHLCMYIHLRVTCYILALCFSPSASLAVEYTWDTQCRSQDAEGAFLICGTLYVVYNTRYGGRSTIQCLYDIHDTIHRSDYTHTVSPKYSHKLVLLALPLPLGSI